MDRHERIADELRVEPGTKANLAERTTAWTGGGEYDQLSADELNAAAKSRLAEGIERLQDAQELLWASDASAVLVVFQAMDAAGKDSTIKHVMSGVNPQGVQVVSFKQPSTEELDHTVIAGRTSGTPAATTSTPSSRNSTATVSRSSSSSFTSPRPNRSAAS